MKRIPVKNDLVYLKDSEEFKNVVCKVESFILGVVFVRPKFSRKLVETTEDNLEYILPERLTSEEKKKMIQDYVKTERLKTYKDWNIEIGYINKLETMYPSIDFFRNFHIDFRVTSFNFFLGSGREQIAMMYKKWVDTTDSKEQTCVKLADTKLGEDITIKKQINLFK